jgi:transcription elongation GreA/GreB family factor
MTASARRVTRVVSAAQLSEHPALAARKQAAGAGPDLRPAVPRRHSRPSPGRIAAWQAAAAAALAGSFHAWWLSAAAILLLTLIAAPARDGWLSTVVVRHLRLRARRRNPPKAHADIRTSAIGPLIVRADALILTLRLDDADVLDHDGVRPEPDGPRVECQVVRWTRPRPRAWLVLRACRDAEHPGDPALEAALKTARRRLRRNGSQVTTLTERDIAAVAMLAGSGPYDEKWPAVRFGSTVHIALLARAEDRASLRRLSEMAGEAAPHATAIVPGAPGTTALTGLLLAGSERHAERLQTLAPAAGVRLDRLDGRHGPAVIATLPMGAPLP